MTIAWRPDSYFETKESEVFSEHDSTHPWVNVRGKNLKKMFPFERGGNAFMYE